ncbi:MAG: hypothetical protein ACPG53_03660 [Schleiferiaceae bacterium]
MMRIFIFLLLIINVSLSADNRAFVSWLSDDNRSVYRLNFETGILDVFLENSRENLGEFTLDYSAEDLFSGEQGTLHNLGNRYLVSFSGSGQVFEVSFKDSTITRLDGTYQHGYNFDAYQFVRDGILYSFGGYGFWMENNMLNRYDEVAKEWFFASKAPFAVEVNNKSAIRHLRWYDRQEEVLYVSYDRTLYAYDFTKDSWQAKGRLHEELYKLVTTHFNILNDSTGLAYNDNGYWLLDWRRNQIHELDLSANQVFSELSGLDGVRFIYPVNDEVVVLRKSDKINAGFFRTVHTPSTWKIWNTTRLYTPEKWYKLGAYSLVSLTLAFLILLPIWGYRKNRRKRSDWLEFLTPQDLLLFNALKIGDLDTEEVNRILNLEEEGWEVQRRKRSVAIKAINAFANKALGFDIIERHKSEKDKRQVIYRLNSSLK